MTWIIVFIVAVLIVLTDHINYCSKMSKRQLTKDNDLRYSANHSKTLLYERIPTKFKRNL